MLKRLEEIEELLKALKAQSILPSIKADAIKTPKAANTAQPIKLPGLAPVAQKNPVKQAEQTQNKDIKDMKMREAQEKLNINKSSGQWSLEDVGYQGVKKSGYRGYTAEDNARRKASNIEGAKDTGIKTMSRTKKWSAPSLDAKKQKDMDQFNRKSAVKEWNKEHGWHLKDKKGNILPLKD